MKALYIDREISVVDVPVPGPESGEALIHVIYAGICGTDRELLKGYSGFRGIPGHEFVGRVVECKDARWQGKRVVGEINVTCHRCDWCRTGLGRHCPNRTVMGIINRPGAFAEYVVLPTANLHEVPADVPDETAVFTEPVAAAAEILEQMPIAPSTSVAVVGPGRLGLLVAQVLRRAGAGVTVIGRNTAKLELARSLGFSTLTVAEQVGSAEPGAPTDNVLRWNTFPVVVDTTGSPQGFDDALRLVAPRGTVVMKSTFHGTAHFDPARLVVDEITLLGSRCGDFSVALDLLRGGVVNVTPMISAVFPLSDGMKAFEYVNEKQCLKVLLKP